MGGGACPGNDPQFTGMIGMHGSHASNVAVSECDLLLAFGCRFSDRVATDPKTFATQAKIVQIDIDRAEIDKNVPTDHHVIGDARRVLELLNKKLPKHSYPQWNERIFALSEPELPHDPNKLAPNEILESIGRLTNAQAIIA
jgi:acetolactate synthase-1/2/3 large subunit